MEAIERIHNDDIVFKTAGQPGFKQCDNFFFRVRVGNIVDYVEERWFQNLLSENDGNASIRWPF